MERASDFHGKNGENWRTGKVKLIVLQSLCFAGMHGEWFWIGNFIGAYLPLKVAMDTNLAVQKYQTKSRHA